MSESPPEPHSPSCRCGCRMPRREDGTIVWDLVDYEAVVAELAEARTALAEATEAAYYEGVRQGAAFGRGSISFVPTWQALASQEAPK